MSVVMGLFAWRMKYAEGVDRSKVAPAGCEELAVLCVVWAGGHQLREAQVNCSFAAA